MTVVPRIIIRSALPLICVVLIGVAVGAQTPARQNSTPASAAPQAQITFNRDIAPILFRTCAQCHRPGEAGPFSLLTYADAKSHARQIAAVTKSRFMPPWLPEEGPLKFADDVRLTEDEIARIQAWVEQGAAEGNPQDLPAMPKFLDGWQLGKPDVIVKATKPYALPPIGSDNYWNFVFRAPVDRTRWLKAMEIRPGDKRLVHHANVLVDRQQNGRRLEAEAGAGFAGMELTIESEAFDPDSHFLFWKPGSIPYVEPDGMALRLDKDTDLILNTHLQPSGKPETIQPTLGLYFTDKPATKHPILLQLENDHLLEIPPGEKHFVVTDEFTLPVDVDVLAIYPHAHYLGKDLQAIAKFPGGRSETLIHIPDWNLNWQAVYRYAHAVKLSRGTTISMKFVYDNSDANVRNPNDPPLRVAAGNRATDEMAHLWLQVLPETPANTKTDPRVEILEAMARHNLQKNPEDFEAHYNLAALLMGRGETAQAIAHFAEANRIRPNEPTVNNAFGAALLVAGRIEESIPHLTAALNTRPDYFDARYNLGNALASLGDFRGALAQFQAAVRIHPEDANAEANLGSAFAEIGDTKQARLHYQRALQLNPNHELAKENLQQLSANPTPR
jgi:tetratricopeptide (TPR) repeat protein/mono/diheme cytochrome c family protein